MFRLETREIYGHRNFMTGPVLSRSNIGIHPQQYENLGPELEEKLEKLRKILISNKGEVQDSIRLRKNLGVEPKMFSRFLNRLEEEGLLIAESAGLVGII